MRQSRRFDAPPPTYGVPPISEYRETSPVGPICAPKAEVTVAGVKPKNVAVSIPTIVTF